MDFSKMIRQPSAFLPVAMSLADPAYVSAQLGHANPSITLRVYLHRVPGTRRVSVAVLDTGSANVRQASEKNGGEEGEEESASR